MSTYSTSPYVAGACPSACVERDLAVSAARTDRICIPAAVPPNRYNYDSLQRYFDRVYADGSAPPALRDVTFLWAHLVGDLDDWAKSGLAGVKTAFRWNNQNLTSPAITYTTVPADTTERAVAERAQVDQIVATFPRPNAIWTPDYFTYPQLAVNRWNPRWWNQFYYEFNTGIGNVTGTGGGARATRCLLTDLELEGSNTFGPDGGQTFFYLARGSGMRFKAARAGVALNKLHAFYVGECFKVRAAAGAAQPPCFGGAGAELTAAELEQALTAVATALVTPVAPATTPEYFTSAIRDALYVSSGYFKLPQIGVRSESLLNDVFWTPLIAYWNTGTPALPAGVQQTTWNKVWAISRFLIGQPAGVAGLPQPNLPNGSCNASNCCQGAIPVPGLATADQSRPATQPCEYFAQVATNLTVADNILDTFVARVMGPAPYMNLDAMVNLCQWNALGGWTCEIPTTDPQNTGRPSGQPVVPANGCALQDKWWEGAGKILGINDYAGSCPDFEVPAAYLANA